MVKKELETSKEMAAKALRESRLKSLEMQTAMVRVGHNVRPISSDRSMSAPPTRPTTANQSYHIVEPLPSDSVLPHTDIKPKKSLSPPHSIKKTAIVDDYTHGTEEAREARIRAADRVRQKIRNDRIKDEKEQLKQQSKENRKWQERNRKVWNLLPSVQVEDLNYSFPLI